VHTEMQGAKKEWADVSFLIKWYNSLISPNFFIHMKKPQWKKMFNFQGNPELIVYLTLGKSQRAQLSEKLNFPKCNFDIPENLN